MALWPVVERLTSVMPLNVARMSPFSSVTGSSARLVISAVTGAERVTRTALIGQNSTVDSTVGSLSASSGSEGTVRSSPSITKPVMLYVSPS